MISIIVPVYNAEKYLERCLAGLLNQSYADTEILLIDDGSTDRSGQICDTFSEKYDKIRTVHMDNAGVSAARNRGMEEAEGEYFTFVDADDCVQEEMLSRLLALIEETDSDVAGCGYYTFTDNQTGIPEKNDTDAKAEKLSGQEFIKRGILASDTRCWSKLYAKARVGKLRFDDSLTIGEDMLFLLELAAGGAVFCRTGYKGYGYYINESGAMNRGFKDSYMDQISCWKRAAGIIKKAAPESEARVASILIISTLLVAGKLSLLTNKERKRYKSYVTACLKELKQCVKVEGAFKELPAGYKLKASVYRRCPYLYLMGYGLLKRIKR